MNPLVVTLPAELGAIQVLIRHDPLEVDVRHPSGVWTPIALLGGSFEEREQ